LHLQVPRPQEMLCSREDTLKTTHVKGTIWGVLWEQVMCTSSPVRVPWHHGWVLTGNQQSANTINLGALSLSLSLSLIFFSPESQLWNIFQ
jgi:hypothetical protein